MRNLLVALFLLGALGTIGCSREKLEPVCDGSTPTWESGMDSIMTLNCLGSSCHGAGSRRGDFTSFSGIEPFLTNGKFTREVLEKQSMPQGAATLTQAELNLIQCWFETGYPEN